MKKNIFTSVFLLMWLFLLIGLSGTGCKQDASKESEIQVDKSFRPFYEKFHTDEAYQINHINFPLQSLPKALDSTGLAEHTSFVKKEDWVFQQDFDENKYGYSKKITVLSPELIEEFIANDEKTIGMIRRFAKFGNEWYLIYYTGLGQIKE